jgi:hypothetical protein
MEESMSQLDVGEDLLMALAKLVVAVAWADGELKPEEVQNLKESPKLRPLPRATSTRLRGGVSGSAVANRSGGALARVLC